MLQGWYLDTYGWSTACYMPSYGGYPMNYYSMAQQFCNFSDSLALGVL
jgi:hypothetical protein